MKIIYENKEGGLSVIIPAGAIQHCIKDVPIGVEYQIVEDSEIPEDRTFRNAWRMKDKKLEINLDESKLIAHDKRREARTKEFKPFDEIISKKIPGENLENAETERQKIRDKYETIQTDMDNSVSVDDLKKLLP